MLTINENASVKKNNMKTIIAALSSVALIGVGTTYLLTSKSNARQSSKLAEYFEGDFNGQFEYSTNDENGYKSNGVFSKTSDENGEWNLEFLTKGYNEDKFYDSYILKDNDLFQHQENGTYYCAGYERNIGYAKYKYDLMSAVEVNSFDLGPFAYYHHGKICKDTESLYVVENEDVGRLLICPKQTVNGSQVGIISDTFTGTLTIKKGKKSVKKIEN